jgi:hypothetical protein
VPIDGGVCLSTDGNVCCEGGAYGGCMFSTGTCCENGYFCYEGTFCSSTSEAADDSSGLDTNCCTDEACTDITGLAPYIIPYNQQPLYSGAAGTGPTAAASTSASTHSVAGTTTTSSEKNNPTTSVKTATHTTSPSSSVVSSSPTASRTSGAHPQRYSNNLGGIHAFLAVSGLASLIMLL